MLVMPSGALAVETRPPMDLSEYMGRLEVKQSTASLSETTIKRIYSAYISLFAVGCVYFASTNDEFYDSPEYRDKGGDGTQNWWYVKAEEEEVAERAKLLDSTSDDDESVPPLVGAADGSEEGSS